ncbi:RcnB family protein [Novosphingobium sp. Leaf2]|uniref:RcnB family protein n=1 Tax=Novosphingobium sp. Leaf2 TaxID=1735670 RepID=UPI0006FE4B07|nr:RcnB family protein [Novosphingobium sp. Leaf2]KQM22261.1 hypothetical protein ASE49_02950 [Novosphingobium sp. Leaf2]
MKTFTAALLAAATLSPILAAPAMAQMSQQRDDRDHRNDRGDDNRRGDNAGRGNDRRDNAGASRGYRSFAKGQKFDSRYARNYQVVDYRKYRGVKAPPRGYRYVRSGNDLLLVGVTSNVVAAVTSGMFR